MPSPAVKEIGTLKVLSNHLALESKIHLQLQKSIEYRAWGYKISSYGKDFSVIELLPDPKLNSRSI